MMYKKILFDVDGVFLSEERCFDASALSVWELLYGKNYLALDANQVMAELDDASISSIRQQVFDHDRVLDWMKSKGINSNWDMVFLVFSAQLLQLLKTAFSDEPEMVRPFLEKPMTLETLKEMGKEIGDRLRGVQLDFASFPNLFKDHPNLTKHELLTYLNVICEKWFHIPVTLFSRNSFLWELGYLVYQEWYLGDSLFEEIEGKQPRLSGKTGFLHQEIPLRSPDELRQFINELKQKGVTVGIGTGRSLLETQVPFEALGLWDQFDSNQIATATDVIEAEEKYPGQAPLGKPEPYTYIKAHLGKEATVEDCLGLSLPIEHGEEILIVGDSVADLFAARKMGCHFAAVLTGLTGKAARSKFEELQADYIFEDVLGIRQLF